MTLIISIEAANWIQLQSTREDRTQLTHDEECTEYLHRSRRGRQHVPVLNCFSKQCAHRTSIGREGSASKDLDEALELEEDHDLE